MLLPELEVDLLAGGLLASLLDVSGSDAGTAEIDADVGLETALEAVDVSAVDDSVAQGTEELAEVRAAKVGAALELGEGIFIGADGVEDDVVCGVDVDLLGEVGVDAQELVAVVGGSAEILGLERG